MGRDWRPAGACPSADKGQRAPAREWQELWPLPPLRGLPCSVPQSQAGPRGPAMGTPGPFLQPEQGKKPNQAGLSERRAGG